MVKVKIALEPASLSEASNSRTIVPTALLSVTFTLYAGGAGEKRGVLSFSSKIITVTSVVVLSRGSPLSLASTVKEYLSVCSRSKTAVVLITPEVLSIINVLGSPGVAVRIE